MSKVVEEVGIGAALVGASVFIPGGFLAAGSLLTGSMATILASAGAGMVLSGVGTLLSQKASGIASTSRNPIMPWQIVYGRRKVGGTIVYQEEVASNNRILLLVVAVAAHPCDAIEQVFFNNKPVIFEINSQFADQANPNGFWQSYDPPQGTWNIETISRVNDVVSVTFTQNPNSIFAGFNGQTLQIQNSRDAAGGNSFDGYFPVVQTGPAAFTYTCGGPQGAGTGNPGTVKSTWPQYGGTITAGYYLGNQTQASGIITGNTAGYWTSAMVLQGRTYVALKLIYNSDYYNGLPEISFVVRGKNNIYDPRTGTCGYTDNAALCIADYLAQPTWGFNAFGLDSTQPEPVWTSATWGTQIPAADLISAANICDESVTLALGGTEPRYQCDGAFDVSVKRAEVLQNLLTSCGGRLVEIGGQFFIQPAAWVSPSGAVTIGNCSSAPKMMMSSTGLVPDAFNSPANSFVPGCAGTTKSQFIYTLGMLQAYQATGNSNALALANMALAPIESILFRNAPIPSPVTAQNIWSPNWAFDVKQAFAGDAAATISVNQDFASDFATPAGWRPLNGLEVQTNGDAYNWAIRLFGLAAQVIDGVTTAGDSDPGYGLSPYGSVYGDPETAVATVNSGWLTYLNAILAMAGIAYRVTFSTVIGNALTVINPEYQGAGVPYAVEFTGSAPSLTNWIGPYYTGYQSPYAVKQVNPGDQTTVAEAVLFLANAQNAVVAQATGADTVVFTVTGPNAQTLSVPIQVNSLGQASAGFSYAGLAAGIDSIVATLPSHSLTSNQAKILWSAYAEPIAVYGVQISVMAADGTGLFNGATAVLSMQSVEGLMFNSHPQSIFPGDPHQSGNQANPFVSNIVTTTGGYGGDEAISNTSGQFNAIITGGFSIGAPGPVTFTAYVNSAFVIGVQGATFVSGTQNFGTRSTTAQNGYVLLAGLNTAGDWPGGNWAQVSFTLDFAAVGLYNFEINYASGEFGEREFCLLASSLVIPVADIAAGTSSTATGTAPSGQLQLTPYSGGAVIGSTISFVLTLTGISYTAPGIGPFAPVFYFQVPAGAQTWGPVNTFGWAGPDPNTTAGYYQYRPLAELCDLIATCVGTESYYSQAVTVVDNFLTWLAGKWSVAADGPPNYFPQTGAQITAPDVHCAALILHSVLALDLYARPTGAGGEGAMNSTQYALLDSVYLLFEDTYLSTGPMAGTFCLDPTGNQDWSPIWHGEILRSLSMLVQWATVNAQSAIRAQAIIWIDGLINFSLNQVVVVDSDLGYTVNDLSGPLTWRPNLARTDLFNGIKGTYISEANKWQQTDFPSYAQDTIHGYTNGTAAHDNDANWDADGERLWKDVQLPFTTSVSMAQRLAKIELLRIRWQGRGGLQGTMNMYQAAPLDVVYFSFAPFGWVNKVLEIANCRLILDNKAMRISTEIDIQETDSSVYEWSITEELNNSGYSYVPGLQNLSPD